MKTIHSSAETPAALQPMSRVFQTANGALQPSAWSMHAYERQASSETGHALPRSQSDLEQYDEGLVACQAPTQIASCLSHMRYPARGFACWLSSTCVQPDITFADQCVWHTLHHQMYEAHSR